MAKRGKNYSEKRALYRALKRYGVQPLMEVDFDTKKGVKEGKKLLAKIKKEKAAERRLARREKILEGNEGEVFSKEFLKRDNRGIDRLIKKVKITRPMSNEELLKAARLEDRFRVKVLGIESRAEDQFVRNYITAASQAGAWTIVRWLHKEGMKAVKVLLENGVNIEDFYRDWSFGGSGEAVPQEGAEVVNMVDSQEELLYLAQYQEDSDFGKDKAHKLGILKKKKYAKIDRPTREQHRNNKNRREKGK